ncbi:type II toxin-antitoxin system Phd/YefM family antitoxin [Terrilactibacillus sp. S3-3]|nr:type II toxin-antitoxin system Phd/YefM family antitoxin [Terrilactibacillus sp. S3-3]
MGGAKVVKPKFSEDQIIPASIATKKFSQVRKQAKEKPQVITDNQKFDSVILDYKQYEKMYERIQYLEDKLIYQAAARINEFNSHPDQAIPLKSSMSQKEYERYQRLDPDDIADEDLFE